MDMQGTWKTVWRWVTGAAAVAYVAFGAYTGDGWVFPFSYADLGLHELGHLLAMFGAADSSISSPVVRAVGGHLGLSAYFAVLRRTGSPRRIMLAWAGTSTNNVSVYIRRHTPGPPPSGRTERS